MLIGRFEGSYLRIVTAWILIFFLHFGSSTVLAGTWSRISETVLKFEGEVIKGDIERFVEIYKPTDRALIVNSKGGDAQIGVKLGIILHEKNIDVIVDGICASSCANYIFIAAQNKNIRSGIVGYHGNITAFLKFDWEKTAKELKEEQGMNDEQVELFRQQLEQSSRLEQDFLVDVGVSQDLFDRSQQSDKGKGDGENYALFLPSPESFEKYGIANVTGNQDLVFAQQLKVKMLYE
ncbi:MAG: hypothetical protein HYW47_00905 [Deltaproteobacteria bacterium]|nr:hypothetical protein [Deltaproteobacteria bacterium]